MSWYLLALAPLLACAAACLPLRPAQRAAVTCLSWLVRLAALATLALLAVLALAPEWLPADGVVALDAWLRLPPPGTDSAGRVLLALAYAGAVTLAAAPALILLDFTRSLGRYEAGCRTLNDLLRQAIRLGQSARPSPAAAPPLSPAAPPLAPKVTANRRPLRELLG